MTVPVSGKHLIFWSASSNSSADLGDRNLYRKSKPDLTGPVYTIFTPFDKDYNVDYMALQRYLETLYTQGARKFYAMAYNSRYSQLTHSEIMELNGCCARMLKDIDSRNVVIVGDPIHCSTYESIEFAKHAKDSGADLISLIMREKYFTNEQVLEHFSLVGRKAEFPILVHEMPFLSGFDGTQMHWPASLLEALPQVDEIVALKEDAKDVEITRKALEHEPEISIVIAGGGKAALKSYLEYGAKSWLNGISIIDASIAEYFWTACQNGDEEKQNFVIEELEVPFFGGVVKKYGWHRTNKALLQAAGHMHRRDRMPLAHLNDQEFREVEAVYAEIAAKWAQRKAEEGS